MAKAKLNSDVVEALRQVAGNSPEAFAFIQNIHADIARALTVVTHAQLMTADQKAELTALQEAHAQRGDALEAASA